MNENGPESEDQLETSILSVLNGLRDLVDASTDRLFAELPNDETWDDHPADFLRTLALDAEQEIGDTAKELGIKTHFDRSDGTWKSRGKKT